MDRHHTEYVRKVRAINTKNANHAKRITVGTRQSARATQASNEVKNLLSIIADKDREIEQLCAMLDQGGDDLPPKATADCAAQTLTEEDLFVDQCLAL
jgi:hypothetical protein